METNHTLADGRRLKAAFPPKMKLSPTLGVVAGDSRPWFPEASPLRPAAAGKWAGPERRGPAQPQRRSPSPLLPALLEPGPPRQWSQSDCQSPEVAMKLEGEATAG